MAESKSTRLVIDCGPGVGIEEILQHFAENESRCKIRAAGTAKAMIDSGAVLVKYAWADEFLEQFEYDGGERVDAIVDSVMKGLTNGN